MTDAKHIALYQIYISRSIAALAGVCLLSVFLYGVFLMLAVEHTAARTAVQKQVDTITLQLSTLETQYLAGTKTLTPTRAATLGFVPPTQVSAVYADKTGAGSLSLKQ